MKNRDHMEEMLANLFGSTSRPRILSLLLSHPQRTFYQREIMYETGLSLQTAQRELENLIGLGILMKRETKARVYYQVNPTSPWFRPSETFVSWLERIANPLTEFFSQLLKD